MTDAASDSSVMTSYGPSERQTQKARDEARARSVESLVEAILISCRKSKTHKLAKTHFKNTCALMRCLDLRIGKEGDFLKALISRNKKGWGYLLYFFIEYLNVRDDQLERLYEVSPFQRRALAIGFARGHDNLELRLINFPGKTKIDGKVVFEFNPAHLLVKPGKAGEVTIIRIQ